MTPDRDVLEVLERYYDLAPRARARTEEVGPLTLFVRSEPRGWHCYARPRLGVAEVVATVPAGFARHEAVSAVDPGVVESAGEQLGAWLSVLVGAYDDSTGAVGGGSSRVGTACMASA